MRAMRICGVGLLIAFWQTIFSVVFAAERPWESPCYSDELYGTKTCWITNYGPLSITFDSKDDSLLILIGPLGFDHVKGSKVFIRIDNSEVFSSAKPGFWRANKSGEIVELLVDGREAVVRYEGFSLESKRVELITKRVSLAGFREQFDKVQSELLVK